MTTMQRTIIALSLALAVVLGGVLAYVLLDNEPTQEQTEHAELLTDAWAVTPAQEQDRLCREYEFIGPASSYDAFREGWQGPNPPAYLEFRAFFDDVCGFA